MQNAHDLALRLSLAQARGRPSCARGAALAVCCAAQFVLAHCRWVEPVPAVPPSTPSATPTPTPLVTPTPTAPAPALRPVRRAPEEVVVAAWAEPAGLPPEGGEVRLFVRAQKRSGKPFPGVEVRLETSQGALVSAGRLLVTDAHGLARDRLSTRRTATIVLNAGGTRYKFDVALAGVAVTPP